LFSAWISGENGFAEPNFRIFANDNDTKIENFVTRITVSSQQSRRRLGEDGSDSGRELR